MKGKSKCKHDHESKPVTIQKSLYNTHELVHSLHTSIRLNLFRCLPITYKTNYTQT